jgi:hypothetical protein
LPTISNPILRAIPWNPSLFVVAGGSATVVAFCNYSIKLEVELGSSGGQSDG